MALLKFKIVSVCTAIFIFGAGSGLNFLKVEAYEINSRDVSRGLTAGAPEFIKKLWGQEIGSPIIKELDGLVPKDINLGEFFSFKSISLNDFTDAGVAVILLSLKLLVLVVVVIVQTLTQLFGINILDILYRQLL